MDYAIRFTPISDSVWSLLILSKDLSMQLLLKDFDRLYLSSSSKIFHIHIDLPGVELASFSIDVSRYYDDMYSLCEELGIEIL